MFNLYDPASSPSIFLLQPNRRLLYLVLLGWLLLVLAACQPIAPAAAPVAEKTSLPQATSIAPSVTPVAEPEVTEAIVLAPTIEPTTENTPISVANTATVEIELLPSPTVALILLVPTDTPRANPLVRALNSINVRSGPATDYPIVNGLALNTQAAIVGKSPDASWWQISLPDGSTGWVYALLVETTGNVTSVTVTVNIPPAPTATPPQPIQQVATVAEQPDAAPTVAEVPTLQAPVATEQPAPIAAAHTFRVIEKRLWDVYENGGTLDGESVKCGEKRQLVVVVVDANGVRLNGVAVQAQYGSKEIFVTGSQGKGDGAVEFVLGGGQDVTIIRDADGSAATSEMATGLTTMPDAIPFAYLIAGHYCTDDASCTKFVAAPGCWGHYSWTVTFQRNP